MDKCTNATKTHRTFGRNQIAVCRKSWLSRQADIERFIETERHICWAIFGQKIDKTAGIIQQTAAKMAKSK